MRTRLVLLALCLSLALTAFADVPPMINYQGKLLTPAGAAVADTAYVMQFAIYDAPAGGTQLWSEPPASVQVKKGLFSVLLGSVNNLGPNLFSAPNRFLGIKVGADAEMTPRQQIVSSAFAFKAATADMASTAVNALIANTVADGAITTDKIADNSISVSKLKPVEPWTAPVLLNGWSNYDTGYYSQVGFFKDLSGVVHIRGLAKRIDNSASTIFILPAGYRPAYRGIYIVGSAPGSFRRVDVEPDGTVFIDAPNSDWLSIEGISFRGEQ